MTDNYKLLLKEVGKTISSKITYEDGVLTIEGFDKDKNIIVNITYPDVLLVKILDEGNRLRLTTELNIQNALILEGFNNDVIPWLKEETLDTRDLTEAKHYVLLIGEEIVDVVSISEPEVEWFVNS